MEEGLVEEQREEPTAGRIPLLPPGWTKTTTVVTETVPGREGLKKGTAGTFEVFSDEPADYGGQGEWPTPLGYAALAIGW